MPRRARRKGPGWRDLDNLGGDLLVFAPGHHTHEAALVKGHVGEVEAVVAQRLGFRGGGLRAGGIGAELHVGAAGVAVVKRTSTV